MNSPTQVRIAKLYPKRPSFYPKPGVWGREASLENDFPAQWYAVYTASRHEKAVDRHLSTRRIEHYLPLYCVQRRWSDGSRVTLQLPLFPSYIFVRIDPGDRARVLEVPGVLALVGGASRQPVPLPEADIETLRNGLPRCGAEPHAYLKAGQRARIQAGALAGMEGVVVRRKSGLRVVLTLDLIMQSIAVDVGEDQLVLIESDVRAGTGSKDAAMRRNGPGE